MSTPRAAASEGSQRAERSADSDPSAPSSSAPTEAARKEFSIIPLTAEFLKMLGTSDEKAIYALKPVFATRCERLSSTNKLLERAVLISEVGTLRIIDTSNGRITHTVEFGAQRNLDWNIEVEADEAADPATHVQGVRIVIDKCATASAFANVDDDPPDKPEELCLFFHCKRAPVAVSFVAMLKHFAAARGSRSGFRLTLAQEPLLDSCRKGRGGIGNAVSSMRKSSIFGSPERTASVVEVAKKKKKEIEKKGEVIVVPPPAVVPSVREQKRREKEEKERREREAEEERRRQQEAAAAQEREAAERRRREDEQRQADAQKAQDELKRQAEATTSGYDSDDNDKRSAVVSNPLADLKGTLQDVDDVEVVDDAYPSVVVRSAAAPSEGSARAAAGASCELNAAPAGDHGTHKEHPGDAPFDVAGARHRDPPTPEEADALPQPRASLGELLRLMKAQTAVAKSGISETTSTDVAVDDYGGGETTRGDRNDKERHRRRTGEGAAGHHAVADENDDDYGYVDPHRYFDERGPSGESHAADRDPLDVIEDRFIDSLSAKEAQQIVSGLIRSIEDLKKTQIRLMDERDVAVERWKELTSVSLSSEHAIQLAQLIWDICEITLLKYFDR